MQQLEQVVLGLVVLAGVSNGGDRQLCVLDAVLLLTCLAECAAVEPDDRRVAEIRIHSVESGGVRYGDVAVVRPRHGLRHEDLLVLRGYMYPWQRTISSAPFIAQSRQISG